MAMYEEVVLPIGAPVPVGVHLTLGTLPQASFIGSHVGLPPTFPAVKPTTHVWEASWHRSGRTPPVSQETSERKQLLAQSAWPQLQQHLPKAISCGSVSRSAEAVVH